MITVWYGKKKYETKQDCIFFKHIQIKTIFDNLYRLSSYPDLVGTAQKAIQYQFIW